MKIDITLPADRDYAIMLIACVGCIVKGIDDPSLYDSAGVDLRASEYNAMMARMLRASYTRTINAGIKVTDETKNSYDFLLQLYEDRFFEAKNLEARKYQEANDQIAHVIDGLYLRMEARRATIH